MLIGSALAAWNAAGQLTLPEPVPVRSQTGQFVVSRVGEGSRNPAVLALATNRLFLELEPSLLVVSCERVRQAIGRELGLASMWQGKVQVTVFTATGPNDLITLEADQFRKDWNYRLRLPDILERRRLMRALVQVVLLENANRQATARSAELPPWLAVGLAEHLLATAEAELLFEPPRFKVGGLTLSRMMTTAHRSDPLQAARQHLSEQSPLTLQELSWPTEQDFTGDTSDAYHASAQLFVTELLQLRNGPASFRAFLTELPKHLNWQTAFLKAFHRDFQRLLDVEKWWALQAVYFTGRDLAHTWPTAESWEKLESAIRVPAQVRNARNELPDRSARLNLQTVVAEWDSARQTPALQSRLHELQLVKQRVNPELYPLAEDYRQLLMAYVQQRDKLGGFVGRHRNARVDMRRLIQETVRQLDALDARLESCRPQEPVPEAPVAAAAPRAE